MNAPFGFGAIQSPNDYRDAYVASAVAKAAPKVEVEPVYVNKLLKQVAVLHQRKTSACVSHAWAILMKIWWFQQHGEWVDFSPRFLDIMSDETWLGVDDGRVPRTVAKISATVGCATTKTVPNSTSLSNAKYRDKEVITAAALKEAEQYKIPGYIELGMGINIDRDRVRTAAKLYGGVSTLFAIGEEFWVPSWAAKDVDPLRIPQRIVSGHQMVVGEWSGDRNAVRNSWGPDWANEGNAAYNVAVWRPYVLEAWAIAFVPEDVKTFLSQLPSPKEFSYVWRRTMIRGMEGEDVKMLQVALMILGLLEPVAPKELGYFGPKTERALGKYQQSKKISPVPWSAGPATRAQLHKDFAV